MMASLFGIVFDGLAYGSLLFLISVGLSVTLGLMNVVNLAHGAFAMFGGYTSVWLMTRWEVPFLWTLPLCFIALASVGALAERLLYRRLYGRSHLDQVLLTIGLSFMSVAAATYYWGPSQQAVVLPELLRGQVSLFGVALGAYRLFLVALVVLLTLCLGYLVERTRFGAQLRASVDNQRVSAGLGIPVDRIFCVTFALGSGLSGLGGALGIDVLGLEPTFALQYLVYFLLVVTVAGAGSLRGTALASLLLGVCDVAGKYYLPQFGAFIIYALMIVLLIVFPAGLYGRRA
jgi:branched-chain amino acid transport system permease protein